MTATHCLFCNPYVTDPEADVTALVRTIGLPRPNAFTHMLESIVHEACEQHRAAAQALYLRAVNPEAMFPRPEGWPGDAYVLQMLAAGKARGGPQPEALVVRVANGLTEFAGLPVIEMPDAPEGSVGVQFRATLEEERQAAAAPADVPDLNPEKDWHLKSPKLN